MSSLHVRHCSKVYVSSFKFELIVEKKSKILPSLIDLKLDLIDLESQKLDSVEFLNKAQAQSHENV